MVRFSIAFLVLVLGTSAVAAADDGKPIGSWTRKAGDNSVRFDIKADGMQVTLMDGTGSSIKIDASYTVKDGMLSGVIKKVERKGIDGGPGEGDKFGFRFKVEKDKMILSELKGTDSDEAKQLVEGEYQKAKE
jgi:hypothetical protein